MIKLDGWAHGGFSEPSVPTEDVNPSAISFSDISSERLAYIASSGILLDALIFPSDNGSAIAVAISNGTAAAVSDGSFDGVLQRGSSAFILAPTNT